VRLKKVLNKTAEEAEAYLSMLKELNALVVLFGSRGRGDYRGDSDWDILVVIKDKSSVPRPYLPVDLFIYTPNEVFEEIKKFNTIVIDAILEGKVLADNINIYSELKKLVMNEIRKRKVKKTKYGWFKAGSNQALFNTRVSSIVLNTSLLIC